MSPELTERLKLLLSSYSLPLAIGLLGVLFIGVGIFSMLISSRAEEGVVFELKEDGEGTITVDVAGSVVNTGVYTLPSGSRMQDALIAAGGLSASADREWVGKVLNLAAKLTDGQKIYIPTKNQNYAEVTDGSSNSSSVNINTASQVQLEKLPGIGPVTAQKIIDRRPYSDVSELLSKKVVGKKVFEQIKDRISVY